MLSGLQMKYLNAMMLYINVIIMCVQLFAIIISLMYQHLKNLAFCKSTSYIPAKIPQPTSYIPNIPHLEHTISTAFHIPTSQTSHILNIPQPQYLTSRTYHIPNIPHPKYSTSLSSSPSFFLYSTSSSFSTLLKTSSVTYLPGNDQRF